MQNSVGQQNIPHQICQPQCQPAVCQQVNCADQVAQTSQCVPQYQAYTSQQNYPQYSQQQGQNVSVPNYSGVNIQIFNPSVTPPGATPPVYNVNAPNYAPNGCYPSGYYTNNWGQQVSQNVSGNPQNGANVSNSSDKKTEKRDIVQLTDEYIMNLENYLNSQDKDVRMMGAKEVFARLDEDHSRKDDKALNALINKMLQDPYTPVRVLAMSALNSRIVTGDDFTVRVLQQMQNSPSGYGQDGLSASEILLKMSGKTVQKEFEVKETKKTETKKESKGN